MPTLESLKAEHPEWCWKCGCSVRDTVHSMDPHCDTISDDEGSPVISALTSAKLEDEATIREKDARIEELGNLRDYCKVCPNCGAESDKGPYAPMDEEGCCLSCGADCSVDGLSEWAKEQERGLTTEQAAHAATREELRKADEALVELFNAWIADDPMISDASTRACNEAKDRQAQRAAETEETK